MAIGLEEIKRLSPKAKVLIVCLLCLLLGYFHYVYFLQGALERKAALDAKFAELERQVSEKEKVVSQIDRYVREVGELKLAFQQALQKLPNRREIPGLLASVALSGREAGVEFLLFEPKPPEKKAPEAKPAPPPKTAPPPKPAEPEKFYEEIPVRIQFTGSFHNTLAFFEKVGRAPRIVNIEQIEIGEYANQKGRGAIVKTSCTVKTYMFVDRKP